MVDIVSGAILELKLMSAYPCLYFLALLFAEICRTVRVTRVRRPHNVQVVLLEDPVTLMQS